MKKTAVLIIVIFLFSSCTSTEILPAQTPIPTSTPEFTQTQFPIATETPLPTLTPTATLAPFTVDCIINDKTSTEKDCQLIRDAVDLGRHYLLNNFGRDISGALQIKLLSQPNNLTGGHYGQGFSGHMNSTDPNNGVIEINTAHPFWSEYTSADNLYRHTEGIIHEFTHFWEFQHGCWRGVDRNQGILDIFNEGQAQYIADMAIGKPELINSGQSVVNWTHWKYDENLWFNDTSTDEVAFKDLMDQYSPNQYMNYCDLMLQGTKPETAFQSVFGITIQEFRSQFKERTLGILKDCTQATCGDTQASDADIWKLSQFDDHTLTEPNLVVNFTDENGLPAENTILTICKVGGNYRCSGGEDRPIDSQGKFTRPLKAGTYILQMCEPGYAENSGNPIKCVYGINPFEIVSGQITVIDFQFHHLQNTDGAAPNFEFTLLDTEGNPVPSQYIQICVDQPVSYICLNTKTDSVGKYKASFRAGKYLMRFVRPGQGSMDPRGVRNPDKYGMHLSSDSAEYEIFDIQINDAKVTKVAFQYPKPNFKVTFKDAYGGAVLPNLVFWMCKTDSLHVDEKNPDGFTLLKDQVKDQEGNPTLGDCSYEFGADKTATFVGNLEPGRYAAFFNVTRPVFTEPFEYELTDINVVSETEMTEITFHP